MAQLSLETLRCNNCDRQQLGPRSRCRFCGHDQLTTEQISGPGTLYSFTVIRVPPARFAQDAPYTRFAQDAPYTVVAVRYGDDVTVTGRVKNSNDGGGEGDLRIGQPLQLVAHDETGYWFVPTG